MPRDRALILRTHYEITFLINRPIPQRVARRDNSPRPRPLPRRCAYLSNFFLAPFSGQYNASAAMDRRDRMGARGKMGQWRAERSFRLFLTRYSCAAIFRLVLKTTLGNCDFHQDRFGTTISGQNPRELNPNFEIQDSTWGYGFSCVSVLFEYLIQHYQSLSENFEFKCIEFSHPEK